MWEPLTLPHRKLKTLAFQFFREEVLHCGYHTIPEHRRPECVCASPMAPNLSDAARDPPHPQATLETRGSVPCLLLTRSREPVPGTMLCSAVEPSAASGFQYTKIR